MKRDGRDYLVTGLEEMVGSTGPEHEHVHGVLVGRLIGIREPSIPLVIYSGQPGTVAIPARTIVDLYGEHIGRDVLLTFDGGNPHSPIVLGCLKEVGAWPSLDRHGQVEVEAEGQRLTINATQEMTLRCGEASITLTREGRVAIRGTYVVTQSTGVNRIRGGSVQIN